MAQKSILDAFSRIKSDSDAKVPDLCINLINHLFRHAQPSDEVGVIDSVVIYIILIKYEHPYCKLN